MKKLITAVLLMFASTAHGATYYVSASTGSDSNPGSQPSPFKRITKALTVATSGDTINVLPGTYDVANGEVFPITMKSGVELVSASVRETVIDGAGSNQRVFNLSGTSQSTLIKGFTVKGGLARGKPAQGGAFRITNGDASTISSNFILGNEARGDNGTSPLLGGMVDGGAAYGGAVFVDSSTPLIVNNVISENAAHGGSGFTPTTSAIAVGDGGVAEGGAIYAAGGARLVNNTINGNEAKGGNGGSGATTNRAGGSGGAPKGGAARGIATISGGIIPTIVNPDFINNIFSGNSTIAGTGGAGTQAGSTPSVASADGALSTTSTAVRNNLYFENVPSDGATGTNPITGLEPGYHWSFGAQDVRSFILHPAAAARDGGTLTTDVPATDLLGLSRSGTPSIGALEDQLKPNSMTIVMDPTSAVHNDIVWILPQVTCADFGACVVVKLNGMTISECPGFATSAGRLSAGSYQIFASYDALAGGVCSSAFAIISYVVAPAPTTTTLTGPTASIFGQPLPFNVSVTAPNNVISSGTVTLLSGQTVIATATPVAGNASFTIDRPPVGTYVYSASYSGANFVSSTSAAISHTVNRSSTATALTSSNNPAAAGNTVAFTATVTAASGATPDGSVSFSNGTDLVGTIALAGGSAAFGITLPAGRHDVSAFYIGTANFEPSASPTLSQVVAGTPVRGDADGNLAVNLGDAFYIINFTTLDGFAPVTTCGGDVNNDGSVTRADAGVLAQYLFGAGGSLPACP